MPHVIVKLYTGRSDQQKVRIAEEITKAVMATANCDEQAVSVSIEDVASEDWTEKAAKPDQLFKRPGYDPR
jgi:4-oxalocrotonate tautomerase